MGCVGALQDLLNENGHGRVAYHPVLLEWTDLSCKHIKARASLFPGNLLAETFYFEAVGLCTVDRVLDDQGEQVFTMFFHNVSEPVAITFEVEGTFNRITATQSWEQTSDEALKRDEGLCNGKYHTKTKKSYPNP